MKLKTLILLTMVVGLVVTGCGGADSKESETQNSSTDSQTGQSDDTEVTGNQSNESLETYNEEESDEYKILYTGESNGSDLLTIEEVDAKTMKIDSLDATFYQWKIKVRNTSGEDLKKNDSSMRIWYAYLDENGDKLYDSYLTGGYSTTVEKDQAEWIESNGYPSSWGKAEMDAVKTIKFYGYTTTLAGVSDHEFKFPISVDIR